MRIARSTVSIVLGTLLLLGALCPVAPADADPAAGIAEPERTVVVFRKGVTEAARTLSLRLAGIPEWREMHRIPEIGVAIVQAMPKEERALASNPLVAWVGPDQVVQILSTVPDDPEVPSMTNLADIGIFEAWDTYPGPGGFSPSGPFTGAPIAVLDSGIDPDHVEFSPLAAKVPICESYPANILYDPVNCYSHPTDVISHGTHVAGIAAAIADNSAGIAGVSPTSPIFVYKTCQGRFCWLGDLTSGLVDATNDGAKVINMSLGGFVPLPFWRDAVNYAAAHDVVLVAAAGNAGTAQYSFPASFPSVLSVAALETGTGDHAWFSQYNDGVDIAAPGTGIVGPVAPPAAGGAADAFTAYSGTSMATPHVAGVAALVRSAHPDWDAGRVRAALLNTATDVETPGRDRLTGMGRVNAAAAIAYDPADDGDFDDDGVEDVWDAAPGDPILWQVQVLNGKAVADGVEITGVWFDILGITGFGILNFDLGAYQVLSVVSSPATATSLTGATLQGQGLRLGASGIGLARWRLKIVDGTAGVDVRLEVEGVIVADGTDPGANFKVRAG